MFVSFASSWTLCWLSAVMTSVPPGAEAIETRRCRVSVNGQRGLQSKGGVEVEFSVQFADESFMF